MTTHHTTESVERLATRLARAMDVAGWHDAGEYMRSGWIKGVITEEIEKILAAQSYTYIGTDGKPVLARDLEDERDALRARLDEAERVGRLMQCGLEFMAADDDEAGRMAKQIATGLRAFLNGGDNG